MCTMACTTPAAAETIEYTYDSVLPADLVINGDHIRLSSYCNSFRFDSITLESGDIELHLEYAFTGLPDTLLETGSVSGAMASSLLGGNDVFLSVSLVNVGTAINIGEKYRSASIGLVKVGDQLQQYGGIDVAIGSRVQRVQAGGWGETGSPDDTRSMRQTWLFHFDGSTLSFESAKRFADVVAESSTTRLTRYYTTDFGDMHYEIKKTVNDSATGTLQTDGGLTIGTNCRAAAGSLRLDDAHTSGFSNAQKAIDGLFNKTDNTTRWTADRDVVTLWLAGDNTVEAVDTAQKASLEVGALQIRQGGSLTMSQTDLAADSILLSGTSSAGASLIARSARVETGFLQTLGSGSSGSLVEIGCGLAAGVVDFQDAGTTLLLHVGAGTPAEGVLFSAGEVTAGTEQLLSASGGGSAVRVRLDETAAASLTNAHLTLVSIGGVTQAYDSIMLENPLRSTSTLAQGQWGRLDAPGDPGSSILLYRYEDGALRFDSTLRSVSGETATSYDAVSLRTGPVEASAIGTGIAADAELQATITDTRTVSLNAADGSITSVSDSVVRTDWTVDQATGVTATGAAPGAISVTSLDVTNTLRLGNVGLDVREGLTVGPDGTLHLGGQPVRVGDALNLNGKLSLSIGGETPSPSVLLSVGSVTGAHASSLTGTSLGGDEFVSLTLDTSAEGSHLLGKQVTLASIGGKDATFESLVIDDGSILATTSGKNTPGMVNLQYQAQDGAQVYLCYAFDGKTLLFGNALTYIRPDPEQTVVEKLPDGTVKTTEKSLQTDKLRQDVGTGAFDAVTIEQPNAADPTQPGTPIQVATQVQVDGSLHLEATTVSEITVQTTQNLLGQVIDTQTSVSPTKATMTALVIDNDLALSSLNEGSKGTVQVDQTVVHAGQTLTLENTELRTGLSLDVGNGGVIDAKGADARIIIGGRKDLQGGLDQKAISDVSGEIYLSDGAELTVEHVGDAGVPQVNLHDATIHLGVSKDNPDGEKTEGSINGQVAPLAMDNVAIRGTGTVRYVAMNGGSLTAGHSPGQLTLEYLEGHDTVLQVSLMGANVQSGKLNEDTTGPSGAISQFIVGQNVSIDGGVFSILWQGDDADTEKMTEGTSFRFFDLTGGRLEGSLTIDADSLPELANEGLTWDFSQLTTTGIARIVGLQFADPSRVANTLVSAGDVVAGFGNMLYGHAREVTRRGNNFWVSGLGDFSNLSSRGGRSGYTYNGGGYAAGYNWVSACGNSLGFAFGQEFGKHDPKLGTSHYTPGSIDQDTVMFGLYGHSVLNKGARHVVSLDAYAAYGRVENRSHRARIDSGDTSSARWNDDVFAVGLTASTDFRTGTATFLRPFIALEFVSTSMDSFRENDGERYADYTQGKYSNFSASAGLQVYRPFELQNGMILTPSLSAAYVGDLVRHDGRVNAADQKGTPLRGHSVSPGRNGFQGSAALDWRINERWGMRGAYTVETRSGAVDQDVNVSVNYAF